MATQPTAKARTRSTQGESATTAVVTASAAETVLPPPGAAPDVDRREEVLEAPGVLTPEPGEISSPPLADGEPPIDEPGPTGPAPRVRLVGLPEEELAQVSAVEIPLGLELGCSEFEDGKIRTGTVISVDVEQNGLVIELDELDWVWPIKIDRIDLGRGEWTHVAADYPAPGANKTFDRAHRMNDVDRREEVLEAPGAREHPNEEDEEREEQARAEAFAAEAQREARGGALATWLGPGHFSGPWVRESDGRALEGAMANAKGYFSLKTIDHPHFKDKFEVHKRPAGEVTPAKD